MLLIDALEDYLWPKKDSVTLKKSKQNFSKLKCREKMKTKYKGTVESF